MATKSPNEPSHCPTSALAGTLGYGEWLKSERRQIGLRRRSFAGGLPPFKFGGLLPLAQPFDGAG